METRRHLLIMTYSRIVLIVLVSCLFQSCTVSNESKEKASINGNVQVMGTNAWPNGIKITLQKVDDNSVKHIASTDLDGKFQFNNIEYGTYIIDAKKEGMDWVWMQVDGEVHSQNHDDAHLLRLYDEQTKQVEILLKGGYVSNSLMVTDVDGIPLNKIIIPKGAGVVSFHLYNGSQHSHRWDIRYNYCIVLGGPCNIEMEYVFNSFNYTEGVLEPGDNILLVGSVNPAIFDPDMEPIVQDGIHLYDWDDVGGDFHTEIEVQIEQ